MCVFGDRGRSFIFRCHLSDTLCELLVIDVPEDAWTYGLYDGPVGGIYKHAVDKGPNAAHARLDFVNGAHLIPKNAIARVRTPNERLSAGPVAICP
jgi:hypothetical protein